MRRVALFLSPLLLTSASALEGFVPAPARLYAQPATTARVVATLAVKTDLTILSCTGGSAGWCQVRAGSRSGFLPRAQVNARGNCAALRAAGLGDLREGEASYNGRRDRDGDGLGCDNAAP